jgi:hypothetical protein
LKHHINGPDHRCGWGDDRVQIDYRWAGGNKEKAI